MALIDLTKTFSRARIPELDGLRGAAIVLVILFHYGVHTVHARPGTVTAYTFKCLSLCFAGVDILFVLSGFLLGGILLDNQGASNLFRVFYIRRALRIFPLYGLFLLSFGVMSGLRNHSQGLRLDWLLENPFPFWSYAVHVQNFFMAAEGRFGPPFAAVTWSLAIEEQFYLAFPLLIYGCPQNRLPFLLTGLVLFSPLARIALQTAGPHGALAGFVLLPSRWDALFMGTLAAWALRNPRMQQFVGSRVCELRMALWACGFGVALFPILHVFQFTMPMAALGHSWIAGTVALFLVLLGSGRLRFEQCIFKTPCLCLLGRISYSIYLFHEAILGIGFSFCLREAPRVGNSREFWLMIACLLTTILLAAITWHTLERPLIRFGHAFKYERTSDPLRMAARS